MIFGAILLGAVGGSAAAPVGDVMMQAFYWDSPVVISAIWNPVPSKGKAKENIEKKKFRMKLMCVRFSG